MNGEKNATNKSSNRSRKGQDTWPCFAAVVGGGGSKHLRRAGRPSPPPPPPPPPHIIIILDFTHIIFTGLAVCVCPVIPLRLLPTLQRHIHLPSISIFLNNCLSLYLDPRESMNMKRARAAIIPLRLPSLTPLFLSLRPSSPFFPSLTPLFLSLFEVSSLRLSLKSSSKINHRPLLFDSGALLPSNF